MNEFPQAFLDRMKSRLNDEFSQFLDAYNSDSVHCIRENPKKKIDDFDGCQSVPWNENGKYLSSKKQFITDPLWHAGCYYVQEASSMVLAHIYKQIFGDNKSPERALDLCAAPGGKSTLLQSLIAKDSVLVANEVIKSRAGILKENHIRLGISENLMITQNDPSHFSALDEFFDFVQIDAPCSGEGMFRKDAVALREWSEANCSLCSERQKRILANIFPALAKDAYLIFSTCTFNPKENEEMMNWACQQFAFESIRLEFEADWNIMEVELNGVFGYYFYPHKVKGEGLFVSVLKKKSGFGLRHFKNPKTEKQQEIPELKIKENCYLEKGILRFESKELRMLKQETGARLNIVYSGIELGELKGNDFIPAQALANFHRRLHNFPKVEVDEQSALEFLRGNDPNLELVKKGIYLLSFKGFGLGWIKNIGNRANNYYPKPWRIKNY